MFKVFFVFYGIYFLLTSCQGPQRRENTFGGIDIWHRYCVKRRVLAGNEWSLLQGKKISLPTPFPQEHEFVDPFQLYGTVYRQQFVKQTACILRSSASSKLICLPCVLLTNYVFMYFTNFCNSFPVRCRVGGHKNRHLLTYLLLIITGAPWKL